MRTVWNAKCGLWNAECDLFVAAAWNFSNLCTKATAERKVNRLPDIGNAPVDTLAHTRTHMETLDCPIKSTADQRLLLNRGSTNRTEILETFA